MAKTVKIEPYTYMHGNSRVDAFRLTVDGRFITGPFPTYDSAMEYAKSHGYEVEGE